MAASSPPLSRRLMWRVEALGYDLLAGLLRLLPIDAASALGGAILGLIGPMLSENRIADLNLQVAFPHWSAEKRRQVIAQHWNNLGRTGVEYILMDRIVADADRIQVVGGQSLLDIAGRKEPLILLSGHMANWETMLIAGLRMGLPLRASYRPANNPLVDSRVTALRRAYGLQLLAAKGAAGSRDMILTLRQGGVVAILNDQRDNNGVPAPFFGVEALTAQGPTRFALKYRAHFIPCAVERLNGARFRVTVYPELPLQHGGDEEANLRAGVAQVNSFIEARIRENPGQYLWSHRRFPWEVYERLGYRPRKR
jgi:KDO2-lipid IV(A) lauroyltransferase